MAYKYVRGLGPEGDYVHFWFKNSVTGRYINFTITDRQIQFAIKNTDNFCESLENIIRRIEEESYYDPRK